MRVGDQIANALPGSSVTETHTVQNVIVTTTDKDFVDVTVAPKKSIGATARALLDKVGKAAVSVAVAAAAITALSTPATAAPVAQPAGTGTLTTTDTHPFYDITQAAFIPAGDLHIGDDLQSTNGVVLTITALRDYHTSSVTYDLTINGLHTYYVEAGADPILVHNCNGVPDVSVSRARYPESAQHIEDAQDAGQPENLTIDRAGAAARRAQSMRGNPRMPGLDRDEYPPTMFEEGGTGSSVRGINPSDNRGAGSSIGSQCRGLPNGSVVHVTVCD